MNYRNINIALFQALGHAFIPNLTSPSLRRHLNSTVQYTYGPVRLNKSIYKDPQHSTQTSFVGPCHGLCSSLQLSTWPTCLSACLPAHYLSQDELLTLLIHRYPPYYPTTQLHLYIYTSIHTCTLFPLFRPENND